MGVARTLGVKNAVGGVVLGCRANGVEGDQERHEHKTSNLHRTGPQVLPTVRAYLGLVLNGFRAMWALLHAALDNSKG